MDFDGIRDGEELGVADRKESTIRIHYMKITVFNKTKQCPSTIFKNNKLCMFS